MNIEKNFARVRVFEMNPSLELAYAFRSMDHIRRQTEVRAISLDFTLKLRTSRESPKSSIALIKKIIAEKESNFPR